MFLYGPEVFILHGTAGMIPSTIPGIVLGAGDGAGTVLGVGTPIGAGIVPGITTGVGTIIGDGTITGVGTTTGDGDMESAIPQAGTVLDTTVTTLVSVLLPVARRLVLATAHSATTVMDQIRYAVLARQWETMDPAQA